MVDGRNPAPVEVGSFSNYLQGFIHPTGGWEWDFWTINSSYMMAIKAISSKSIRPPPKLQGDSSNTSQHCWSDENVQSLMSKNSSLRTQNDINSKWSMRQKSRFDNFIIQLLVEIPIFVAGKSRLCSLPSQGPCLAMSLHHVVPWPSFWVDGKGFVGELIDVFLDPWILHLRLAKDDCLKV